MGKVIKILEKIREMTHRELFERFKHINRAQAIREYLAAPKDRNLTIEVNLCGDEIIKRMSSGESYDITKTFIKM